MSQNIVDGGGPESIFLTSPAPGSYSYSVSTRCQGDVIGSAYWHTLNVTQALRDMIRERCSQGFSTLEFNGNYSSLFGNPAVGVIKELVIVFSDGSRWSGVEYGVVTLLLPQVELSKSRFTVTFYGAASEPLVFVPADIFVGNRILVFNFTVSNDGSILITHVSSSIKTSQDQARISALQTPSAARNIRSTPFSMADTLSRILIHSHNSSAFPTSGSVLLTLFGRQFGALVVSSSMRLSSTSSEYSTWLSDSLVSCKSASSSRAVSSIHVSVNPDVASKNVELGIHNATTGSLEYTSDFVFQNYETPSLLSGNNFGTLPPNFEGRTVSLYTNNVVCSATRWISDSSILCESSPAIFQKSSANISILVGSESTQLSQYLVPINVKFKNSPAICNDYQATSTAAYELASVILKACQGRTAVIDRRNNVVRAFPANRKISSQFRDENVIRFIRLQGRSAEAGLQISHVSVMSADGVCISRNKRVSSSGSTNVSSLVSVVDGPSEARVSPGIWEGARGQDWLEIDLGQEFSVAQIVYYNRLDCCQSRAENALVSLMDSNRNVLDFATLNSDLVQTFNFSSSCTDSDTNSLSCSCGTGFSELGLRLIDVVQCSTVPGVHIFNSTRSCSVHEKSAREFTCSCIGHPSNFNSYRISCGCSIDGVFSCSCSGSSSWNDPEFNTCNIPSIYQQLPGLDICSASAHNCSKSGGLCQMTGLNSFNCSCLSGYRGDGHVCGDIDECTEGSHSCSNGTTCVNFPGGFSCNTDFCAISNNCSAMASCSNSFSSFICTCNSGFQGNGYVCTDIDECASNVHNCWSPAKSLLQTQDPYESCKNAAVGNINCLSGFGLHSALCNNTIGSFTCQCPAGFTGDGRSCADIDECELGTSNCSSPYSNAFCINTFGSYECQCKPGYSGPLSLKTCPEGAIRLYSRQDCEALQGNWFANGECLKSGGGSFSFDNRPQCLSCGDVNECSPGSSFCSANSFCSNSAGSYRCMCNEGFTGDGKTCWDIDECVTNTHNCSSSHKCVNSIGSFKCECIGADCFGFAGDCALNPSMCGMNGICNNTKFGTVCSCRDGYFQMQGYTDVKCAGVYDPLCWTHAITKVQSASGTPMFLSASILSMSDDSRYVITAQSPGFVFDSVLPLTQIRLFSKSSTHAVSVYLDEEFFALSRSSTVFSWFLNPNTPHTIAIETASTNSFALLLGDAPSRASLWKCTISSSMSRRWRRSDFDDSAWASATATSFIASDSSNPSFSGTHQSSQWIGLGSGPVSVSESVSNPAFSPSGLLFDDFQSSVLNPTHFKYTNNPNSYSYQDGYSVGGGYMRLSYQPIISSTFSFNSSSMYPITISGTFKFHYQNDFFVMCTRSDARSPVQFSRSGAANGLCFFFGTGELPSDSQTLSIDMRISGTQFKGPAVRKSSASWKAEVGFTYSYRIVDGGSFAQMFIENRLELSRSDVIQSFMPGTYILFCNYHLSARLTLGPISISINAPSAGMRLFCRSSTPVYRGGRTFTAISSLPSASWVDAAVSASGKTQILAATSQNLRISTVGGQSWVSVNFPASFSTNQDWSCVATSGDGSTLVAATRLKFIYVSRDGIWVQSRISASWKSVAASYDGSRIVAAADNNGGIFFSTDYGNLWSQNTGIRYFGKDWTSISISSEGFSIIAASNWVGQVKEVIPQFFHSFLVLNCTCNHFTSSSYSFDQLSKNSPNYVAQYQLSNYNPVPSSGIDTSVIAFTCTRISGSVMHGIVTSLADSQNERRLFCSSDVSGEAWKSPDFDDSTWQLPSVVNLANGNALNPNASLHIASSWIVDRPSYISSSSEVLWAPQISSSSFSCRYKLPAQELGYQDWIDTSVRPPVSFMPQLWRDATVSERGTSWSAPTPLGYSTFSDSLLACNGANVGSDLFQAQIACEKCIECHSILRVGSNPGVFSLRRDTSAKSYFEQQTTNEFRQFQPGSVPTSFLYNTVSDVNFQSNVWFLGRQVGVAVSHDFGRTWFTRSSQGRWSNALISSDGTTIFAWSNGKMMKTHSFKFIQVSLSFTNIPLPNASNVSFASTISDFSVFGSVSRGSGVVSKHSGTVAANSHIFIPQAAFNSFTAMFWIQTASVCPASEWRNGCSIFFATASNRSFGIHIVSGTLFFTVGHPVASINSTQYVNDSKWHFISASWNASTGAMQLYIDGELIGLGDSMLRDQTTISYVHSIKLGGSSAFSGSYDDVRVFSVAFEPDTIQSVFKRSTQMSIPYGASSKTGFNPIDDDMWFPAAGSCSEQNMHAAAISSDGSHVMAVLQPSASVTSIYDFNSNRRLESYDCIDVDECSLGTHNCSSNQTCSNIQGSFICNCSSGFTRVGNVCVDVDECALGAPCGSSGNCINTIGSFSCACKPGYGNVGCVDINECGATIFPCPLKAVCTNTPGSFTCACPRGTVLNGSACIDVNECETGAHNCSLGICVNSFGSFECVCSDCKCKVQGAVTSVFNGLRVLSSEVFVLSLGSNSLIATAFTTPSENGTFSLSVPMSVSADIQYRLLVKSFHNADVYVPFSVAANQQVVEVNVSVFQYCESLLADAARMEYSGCINSDPNMFIAVPDRVPISRNIKLFGADFPLMLCEARLGINITTDPSSYSVAHSCIVISSMAVHVLPNNSTDSYVPLQIQLLFRSGLNSSVSNVLTSSLGIVTLLNGTAILQSVSPASG